METCYHHCIALVPIKPRQNLSYMELCMRNKTFTAVILRNLKLKKDGVILVNYIYFSFSVGRDTTRHFIPASEAPDNAPVGMPREVTAQRIKVI